MNLIQKLALSATLGLIGVTSVQAQEIAGNDTPATPINITGGGTQWTFSDASLQLYDPTTQDFTAGTMSRTVGQSFIDVFYVNIPDAEYVYFDFGNVRGSVPGVAFTEFAVGYAYTGPTLIDNVYGANIYSVTTDPFELTSATYEFDIYGTFTQAGGGFSGDVFGSAVPEPQNLALMLAGLGVLGSLARRRRHTPA